MAPFPVGFTFHTDSGWQSRSGTPRYEGGWYSAAAVTGSLGGNDRIDEESRAGFWFETVCEVPFKRYLKVKQKM